MVKGQRRYGPPPGYMSATEVIKLLGKTFYRHVEEGRIRKVAPDGHKHGFYCTEDVLAIVAAEKAFSDGQRGGPLHNQDAVFTYATLGDMDALYTCAKKFFPNPASAEVRRGWMRKEPRGHYLMKRVSDGAVVAYTYFLALKPEYLNDYMVGDLPGRKITPDHINRFEPGIPVEACIINAIQSDPDVKPDDLRSNYVAMLLRGVKQDMGMLGKEGIIIPQLYAWSETTEGIALCTRLGMESWVAPKGKRCFFVLDVDRSNARIMRDYKRGLAEWKATRVPEMVAAPAAPTHPPPTKKRPESPIRMQEMASLPPDLPEGTLHINDFATQLGISRTTLLGQVRDYNIEHIAIPKANRPNESDRYFTPEQQQKFKDWRAARRR